MPTKPRQETSRKLPLILIGGGLLGLLAAFELTYDKIQVLKNPLYDPPCNINPIFSCGSVMKTEQASLFGVPNTVFGLMAFSALITFGVMLLSGAKVQKWVWQSVQAVATIGTIFMHYLFFQGVFRINAICPWCFLTWMITIPIFVYVTTYNLSEGNIGLQRFKKLQVWLQKNQLHIVISWYLGIFMILIWHFWYY